MQPFAALVTELESGVASQHLAALQRYLAQSGPEDAAWAVHLLAGGSLRRCVPADLMREQACLAAGLPDWLFDASLQASGDLAETIALVLPPPTPEPPLGLAAWMTQRLLPLQGTDAQAQAQALQAWWRPLDTAGRIVLCRLLAGGFRVRLSPSLLQRALAEHAGLPPAVVAQRWAGTSGASRRPSATWLAGLLAPVDPGAPCNGQPYPFMQAQTLDTAPADVLGRCDEWQAEWKFDGLRAQLVRRAGRAWLWAPGDELLGEAFPEVMEHAAALPDGTVLDGELLVWPEGQAWPAPLAVVQQRARRKRVDKALRQRAPVRYVPFDLLERDGIDLRQRPLAERRAALQALLATGPFEPSVLLAAADGSGLAMLRATRLAQGVKGVLLRHRHSRCGGAGPAEDEAGNQTWWVWKREPLQVNGVLLYAQRASADPGHRTGPSTHYTLAVWSRAPQDAAEAQAVVEAISRREPARPGALQLLPVAKASAGLTAAERAAVDEQVRAHTLEKFGPVRSLRPTLVVELGFEGIDRSARHKSGLVLRSTSMRRLRPDLAPHQADTLDTLMAQLRAREIPS